MSCAVLWDLFKILWKIAENFETARKENVPLWISCYFTILENNWKLSPFLSAAPSHGGLLQKVNYLKGALWEKKKPWETNWQIAPFFSHLRCFSWIPAVFIRQQAEIDSKRGYSFHICNAFLDVKYCSVFTCHDSTHIDNFCDGVNFTSKFYVNKLMQR
jgi:hypothetical protein